MVRMGEVARVRQAGENIFVRQPWVIRKKIAFRLASGEQLEDQLNRQPRTLNHRFAREDLGVDYDAFRPRHIFIILLRS